MTGKKVIRVNLSDKRIASPERGWMVQLLPVLSEHLGAIADIHAVSLEPGVIRGNHVHHQRIEALFPLSEGLTIAWEDENGKITEHSEAGTTLYIFPPNIPHAIRNDYTTTGYAIAFGNMPFDKDQPDRYPQIVLNDI